MSIQAPPQKVFAVLCDVERWPEWTPTVLSVRQLSGSPFAVGSRYEMRQPKLRTAIWQVTDLEQQRIFNWEASAAGLRMKAGHSVDPDGTGSRVELSFEMSGFLAPLISRLYGSLIENYVCTESQKLKSRCESAAGHAADLGNK